MRSSSGWFRRRGFQILQKRMEWFLKYGCLYEVEIKTQPGLISTPSAVLFEALFLETPVQAHISSVKRATVRQATDIAINSKLDLFSWKVKYVPCVEDMFNLLALYFCRKRSIKPAFAFACCRLKTSFCASKDGENTPKISTTPLSHILLSFCSYLFQKDGSILPGSERKMTLEITTLRFSYFYWTANMLEATPLFLEHPEYKDNIPCSNNKLDMMIIFTETKHISRCFVGVRQQMSRKGKEKISIPPLMRTMEAVTWWKATTT